MGHLVDMDPKCDPLIRSVPWVPIRDGDWPIPWELWVRGPDEVRVGARRGIGLARHIHYMEGWARVSNGRSLSLAWFLAWRGFGMIIL